jgi:hypothetical protein
MGNAYQDGSDVVIAFGPTTGIYIKNHTIDQLAGRTPQGPTPPKWLPSMLVAATASTLVAREVVLSDYFGIPACGCSTSASHRRK